MIKQCKTCGEFKDVEMFYSRRTPPHRVSSSCKLCDNAKSRKYREENYDKVRAVDNAGHKAWALAHPEEFKLRQYKNNHSDEHKEWEKKVREHTNERKAEWRKANPDKAKEYHAKTYQNFKEEIKAKNKVYKHLRRSLDKNAHLSKDDLDGLIRAYGNRCCYCHKDLGDKPTIDHIVPIKAGGTSAVSNLTLACQSCNSSKNDSSLLNFMYRRLGK